MKHALTFALVAALSSSALTQTIWYGGEFNGTTAHRSNYGPDIFGFEGMCYDEFVWTSSQPANRIFGSFFTLTSAPLLWEIRKNRTSDALGDMVATGSAAPSLTYLGTYVSLLCYRFEIDIPAVALVQDEVYWLGVSNLTTDGSAEYGLVPVSDGNGAVGTQFSDSYFQYDNSLGGTITQFWGGNLSLGIAAAPIPEPATTTAIGLGIATLLHRRKRPSSRA